MKQPNRKDAPEYAEKSCGAAECGEHRHTHSHEHEHHEESCHCGHQHKHPSGHPAGCDCPLCREGGGCSCGHDHGSHQTGKKDLIFLGIAAVLVVVSFFLPFWWLRLIVQAAATLLAGYDLLIAGVKGLFKLSLDEMTLMSIAVVAAFAIGEGFEGSLVTILFKIGEFFEDKAVQNSRKRIDALVNIVPENANLVLPDGSVQETAAKSVLVGDTILVKPGDRVPLDCTILEGGSDIDTSAVTGESVPVRSEVGDSLLSGMINLNGALKCRVEKSYENSTANKIAELVRDATREKGSTERFITKFSKIYTPVVVGLAVLVAALPPLFGLGEFTTWLHRSLIFLVASCPCALVISVPLTFYSVIGTVSKMGALIKGSKHVEILSKAKNFVFDKTGTLTTGKVTVSAYDTLSALDKEEVLRLAGICESASAHPIAKAVIEKADSSLPAPQETEEIAGKGVRAVVGGKVYYCGSYKLMNDRGISLDNAPSANLYLSDETSLLGYIQIGDTVKPEAKATLSDLKALGAQKTVMLTGDRKEQANATAQVLGVDEVHSDLLPQQKVENLLTVKQSGVTVFVGDGINDGPVLAAADLGIAMGMGSDLATQTADMVLMSNNLKGIPAAIRACRKGMRITKGNIVFILGVKALVLVLGALGYAPMAAAIFADVGVTLIAVLNSLRILKVRKE